MGSGGIVFPGPCVGIGGILTLGGCVGSGGGQSNLSITVPLGNTSFGQSDLNQSVASKISSSERISIFLSLFPGAGVVELLVAEVVLLL